jgi:hypothetical protein
MFWQCALGVVVALALGASATVFIQKVSKLVGHRKGLPK